MARIDHLTLRDTQRPSRHAEVETTYQLFELNGETILQIDTYGTLGREIPGKVSQSIQFGAKGLADLRRILSSLK